MPHHCPSLFLPKPEKPLNLCYPMKIDQSDSPERELSKEAQLAVAAANRAAKKLRERKRALGQKLVVWKDGAVALVDP